MVPVNQFPAAVLACLVVCLWSAGCTAATRSESPSLGAGAPGAATATSSTSPSTSIAPGASPSSTPEPTSTPVDPTAILVSDPTPQPTPIPTPEPKPRPSVVVAVNGMDATGIAAVRIESGNDVDVAVTLRTVGVELSTCKLTHAVVPDKQGISITTVALKSTATQTVAMIDGLHTFVATCRSAGGDLTSRLEVRAFDNLAEKCLGFDFDKSAITVSSLGGLKDGIVGTWEGCVTTPWVPAYWVTVVLRADGTYSAKSSESFDGSEMIAMYYGIDEDSPNKRYQLNDFQDNQQGIGDIDIDFGGSINRDELRHVSLMGDRLEFEVFHGSVYGPITFQLSRSGP